MRQLTEAQNQRRKLLDAYYSAAIDVATLKTEQHRISRDITTTQDTLTALDSDASEWRQILTGAVQIATRCAFQNVLSLSPHTNKGPPAGSPCDHHRGQCRSLTAPSSGGVSLNSGV